MVRPLHERRGPAGVAVGGVGSHSRRPRLIRAVPLSEHWWGNEVARTNLTDLMKNAFYAGIMHEIERVIHRSDAQASAEAGLCLTDSNVKSSIRKALGFLQGKPPRLETNNPRAKWVGRLAVELTGLGEFFEVKRQVERKDYILALLAVEDSLTTRREYHGHPRGYLDFLRGFLAVGKVD